MLHESNIMVCSHSEGLAVEPKRGTEISKTSSANNRILCKGNVWGYVMLIWGEGVMLISTGRVFILWISLGEEWLTLQ